MTSFFQNEKGVSFFSKELNNACFNEVNLLGKISFLKDGIVFFNLDLPKFYDHTDQFFVFRAFLKETKCFKQALVLMIDHFVS